MKRLKEIWKNRKLIFQGIWNTIFRKQYIERVATERLAICYDCEELDEEGEDCAVPGTQPCCKECGCSLAFKTRSLAASCPFNYWVALEESDEDEDEEYEDDDEQ